MVCKTTSTKERGAILTEAVIGLAVGAVTLGALCAFTMFTGQNLATFYNFVDAGQSSRITLNQMAKDFRSATSVTNLASNTVSMLMFDGSLVKYNFNTTNATLVRSQGAQNSTLLKDCNRFAFTMFSRNMTNGTFDYCPSTNFLDCKAVQVTWCCVSKLPTKTVDDIPHSATFVIRN